MFESEFKIGDRVIGVGNADGLCIDEQHGIIVDNYIHTTGRNRYLVEFDEAFDAELHNGLMRGRCASNHGWWVYASNIIHEDTLVEMCPENLFEEA